MGSSVSTSYCPGEDDDFNMTKINGSTSGSTASSSVSSTSGSSSAASASTITEKKLYKNLQLPPLETQIEVEAEEPSRLSFEDDVVAVPPVPAPPRLSPEEALIETIRNAMQGRDEKERQLDAVSRLYESLKNELYQANFNVIELNEQYKNWFGKEPFDELQVHHESTA